MGLPRASRCWRHPRPLLPWLLSAALAVTGWRHDERRAGGGAGRAAAATAGGGSPGTFLCPEYVSLAGAGTGGVPAAWWNDDYCDCPLSGADEPGTAACSHVATATFVCDGGSRRIPAAHVRDGVLDCVDESDEGGEVGWAGVGVDGGLVGDGSVLKGGRLAAAVQQLRAARRDWHELVGTLEAVRRRSMAAWRPPPTGGGVAEWAAVATTWPAAHARIGGALHFLASRLQLEWGRERAEAVAAARARLQRAAVARWKDPAGWRGDVGSGSGGGVSVGVTAADWQPRGGSSVPSLPAGLDTWLASAGGRSAAATAYAAQLAWMDAALFISRAVGVAVTYDADWRPSVSHNTTLARLLCNDWSTSFVRAGGEGGDGAAAPHASLPLHCAPVAAVLATNLSTSLSAAMAAGGTTVVQRLSSPAVRAHFVGAGAPAPSSAAAAMAAGLGLSRQALPAGIAGSGALDGSELQARGTQRHGGIISGFLNARDAGAASMRLALAAAHVVGSLLVPARLTHLALNAVAAVIPPLPPLPLRWSDLVVPLPPPVLSLLQRNTASVAAAWRTSRLPQLVEAAWTTADWLATWVVPPVDADHARPERIVLQRAAAGLAAAAREIENTARWAWGHATAVPPLAAVMEAALAAAAADVGVHGTGPAAPSALSAAAFTLATLAVGEVAERRGIAAAADGGLTAAGLVHFGNAAHLAQLGARAPLAAPVTVTAAAANLTLYFVCAPDVDAVDGPGAVFLATPAACGAWQRALLAALLEEQPLSLAAVATV